MSAKKVILSRVQMKVWTRLVNPVPHAKKVNFTHEDGGTKWNPMFITELDALNVAVKKTATK
jgi:hypothetical protein